MNATLELTKELLKRQSISPEDAGCQKVICNRLKALGFNIEHMPFVDVKNFWARKGDSGPVLAFVGHTDVVPTGPLDKWQSPPFEPEVRDGYLYGRGSADMKGSLAAMITACEKFIKQHPEHQGSIALLITSDEEAASINGTVRVMEVLEKRGEKIDFCLVGEPTGHAKLGDTIKIGRRGTLSGNLTILGKQGHIAYPHLADNPIHRAINAIKALCDEQWDQGYEHFSPTSFQTSNIHAGTGAGNIIPAELNMQFNFRYSPSVSATELQTRVKAILQQNKLNYTLEWHHSGSPFLTKQTEFIDIVNAASKKITGIDAEISTSGGTSDGRFVASTGAQVVEIGPCNATIHQINESVKIDELEQLRDIYVEVLRMALVKTDAR